MASGLLYNTASGVFHNQRVIRLRIVQIYENMVMLAIRRFIAVEYRCSRTLAA